ncbi:MAG: hypothetical protein GF355_04730, partial [Candidatus Eisenbacteria bacterium]|nr:hypothetical protein [Candidatus Eisenbacteria bacterium]
PYLDSGTESVPAGPTALLPARPSPFTGATQVAFRLRRAQEVHLSIYDINGRHVRTLADGVLPAGEHRLQWDGRTAEGVKAGIGVYLTTFRAGSVQQSQKLYLYR